MVFAAAFSIKFLITERFINGVDLNKSSPKFNLTTISRVQEVFSGSAVVRVHSYGDLTLITPWFYVSNSSNETNNDFLQKNTLILPLNKTDGLYKCFIPCGGLDPTTDNIPPWCQSYNIKDIIPYINPMDLYSIRKPGIGKMSAVSKTDYTSIPSHQVDEGDLILCRGQWMEVYAFGDDATYHPGVHDIVRFTKDFNKNINKQKYEIIKWPKLQGRIMELNENEIDLHEPVSVTLNNITERNIGSLKITYRNACFNSLGFLTHDTHIQM